MKYKNFSLLIVAGGKSSRLGTDKRFVEVGGVSLIENIIIKSHIWVFYCVFTENIGK